MAKGEGKDDFVSHISEQEIFSTTPYITFDSSRISKTHEIQDHLVCKNNTYLFNAVGNLVRFCNINEESTNYRYLNTGEDLFEIKSIQLNSSGSLLAAMGYHDELTIYNIPESINMLDPQPYVVKGYKIANIGGSIKKLIWNPIISNDSTLVVLNDQNQIKSWDLSISFNIPQLSIDLENNSNFNGNANSMTFGSSTLFSGCLTLYIATEHKVYSIYPFIHKNAKLALTKSQVLDGFEESSTIFNSIEEKFPSESLLTGLKSYLKISTIRYYEYCKYLKSQLNNVLPIESRNILSSNVSELSIFEQNLPNSFNPSLQGPINIKESSTIYDLRNIYNNNKVSILSVIFANNNSINLSYDVQLNPLIMMWTQVGDNHRNPFTIEKNSVPQPTSPIIQRAPEYVKPKRGFGFVDLTSDSKQDENKSVAKIDLKQQETEFWKHGLSQIDTLAIDILPSSQTQRSSVVIKVYDNLVDKFVIQIDGSIILCSPQEWLDKFIFNIASGESIDDIQFKNTYNLITGTTPQLGLTLVKDILMDSGNHFIQTNNLESDNLKVFSIREPTAKEPRDKDATEKEPSKLSFKFYSVDDLLLHYRSLKFPSLKTITTVSNRKDTLKDTIEFLGDINNLSNEVMQQVSNYNTLIVKVDMILQSEIANLQQQLTKLNSISEKYYGIDDAAKLKEKIEKVAERQVNIDTRLSVVYNKLLDTLRQQVSSKELPLSIEERTWFKEINSINKQLQLENDESIPNRINILENQTKSLSDNNHKLLSNLLSGNVKDLEAKQSLYKFKLWLDEEGKLIEKVKAQQKQNLLIVNNV